MWLLMCSSVLASIGLDTNSPAVIIGAMLISPLMSPILGIGLSIAIHDSSLLVRSLKNLAVAVVLSLTASVLYFLISPFAYPTGELQSRTYPTLLDVLVALFGGIAGIVASARTGPTTAIPGVAIATALMPPLCTAGYGIATGQASYFGGAFYLFFINAVFISLATLLIAKYLHFPIKQFANKRQRRFYSTAFTVIVIVATLPSIYFLYTVYEREQTRRKIDSLVFEPIKNQGNEILKWELEEKDQEKWIKVYHSGNQLSDSLKEVIHQSLYKNGLPSYHLNTLRVNMTKEEVSQLSADVSRQMFQQLQLDNLQKEVVRTDSLPMQQLGREVQIAFPFLDTTYNGWMLIPTALQRTDTLPVVFYKSQRPLTKKQSDQLYQFLTVRLNQDSLVLFAAP